MDKSDICIWMKAGNGLFSTKALWKYIQDDQPSSNWASLIWKPWFMPKISCFLWKSFLRILPTDDAVSRLGIPMPSKCRCCSSPSIESAGHLLFRSERAQKLWHPLSLLFDRPPPGNLEGFRKNWLSIPKKASLIDCLRAGLAGSIVWELWKIHNRSMHGGKIPPDKIIISRWAISLCSIIRKPCTDSFQNGLVLRSLRIERILQTTPPRRWGRFKPWPDGVTINISILSISNLCYRAALVRDQFGSFIFAFTDKRNGPNDASQLISFILVVIFLSGNMGLRKGCIMSSHPSMLNCPFEENGVPWDVVYEFRNILHSPAGAFKFRRIPYTDNNAASVLGLADRNRGLISNLNLLSRGIS